MNIYRFYCPEQHQPLVEQEVRKVKTALDKTVKQAVNAGLLMTWEFDWYGQDASGTWLGTLVIDFKWPIAQALGKVPKAEEWDRALAKELGHFDGLLVYRLKDGLETIKVVG